MDIELAELEREFRDSWRSYDPNRYADYLARTNEEHRVELLARLLVAELEYSFQPPISVEANATDPATEDEERIRPSMHLFVLRFPEISDHQDILIRLAVLEYALRLRHDRVPPNPDSYLVLCKQSPERLIQLLRLTENRLPVSRSTGLVDSSRPSDSTVKESKVSPSVTLDPLPHNLGCFLLLRLVGKGGMGYVHSAIDLRSTAQVAVKVMRRIDPWSVYRFIEEFTWLSQLSHPNLVKLYDAFSEGDVRYFSMELVEGKTIRQWFQKFDPHDESRWTKLRRVLAQAASAIHFLHKHSVIHCDIKCSNLMIASRRRAVLLDLGLAVREDNPQPMVGTLQYMAPEIIEGSKPSRQSDWYSFGILIYEVLTDGYPPVEVDLSAATDDAKYVLNRQKLTEAMADCDPELQALCCLLLSTDPAQRPSGAIVRQRLGIPSHEIDASSAPRPVVGREAVLQQLEDVRQASLDEPGIVVIIGEPGIGKSSVVDHWLQRRSSFAGNELLIRLRCYRQDHTPLRLLNALVQELVQTLHERGDPEWRNLLDRHLKEIGDAFPHVLQLVEHDFAVTAHHEPATPNYLLRSKGIQRVEEWLEELSQSRKVFLVVDDAQWADRESLQLIVSLACSRRFRGFVVVIDETGPAEIERLMRNILPRNSSETTDRILKTIKVEPLTDEAAVELLLILASQQAVDITSGIAGSIARRADGNPFLLLELFRAFSHYAKREGISNHQWLQADTQSSVRRRFSLIPIQSENVLQYLAVAGQSIGFHQLQMVSRILPHELLRTISLLAHQGWVRSASNNLEADVEIAHDNFRKVVLQSLPADRLHRRHFRMARMLSSETPPPWARMGDHYWEAQRYREAAACYLEAARIAQRSSAYQDALSFLDRAELNNADRSPEEREDILRLRADCLAGNGNSNAAAEIYDALGNSSEDRPTKRLYNCLAGEQWIRGGQTELGVARLSHALRERGITNLQPTAHSQFLLRWRAVHMAVAGNPDSDGLRESSQTFTAQEQSLNRVSVPLTFLDNQLGPHLILRMKKRAELAGADFDRALAVLHWGTLLSFAGSRWHKTAARWLRNGRFLARRSGRPAARGSAELCMFLWHLQQGDLNRAMTHGTKALDWFQREPDSLQWETQFLYWGLVGCYWYSGQLTRCRETLVRLRRSAVDRNDSMSLYLMHVGASHSSDLVDGNVEQGRQSLVQASRSISCEAFQSPRFFLWLSQIHQHLFEGRVDGAQQLLKRDWRQLASSFIFGSSYYRWAALCTRLCCNLVQIRRRKGSSSSNFCRDALGCIKRMSKFREPAFAAHGSAFSLLLQATQSKLVPTQDEWHSVVQELHGLNHHLIAHSLTWHQSLYAPDSQQRELHCSAEAFFHREGCSQPERLMDIILPLPHEIS